MITLPSRSHSSSVIGATLALVLLGTIACEAPPEEGDPPTAATSSDLPARAMSQDQHSFSRPTESRVTHMAMDWTVDFERLVLTGSVEMDLQRVQAELAGQLILDSRDLEISQVRVPAQGDWSDVPWEYGPEDEHLGRAVIIQLPAGTEKVRVDYSTSPAATGLQWLQPAQTAGGQFPFLYSQAQALHARSFLPCQDTPGNRVTFEATMRVPDGLTGAMAAVRVGSPEDGVFRYEMPLAIPTYLIALAAGNLQFVEVGPRTGVWAEPELLERSAHEFADMEAMMDATEALYGPYRWHRYDILVLPPSFPFGGMENPMLTFATPTILAGDRSLVALVAHELAHSWSGNLVTNATWSDFWLNEGFTSYIEKRIMEAVYGPQRAEMEWVLSRQDLDEELEAMAESPDDQKLEIDLAGRNPDDGMTAIAYDKGAHFLLLLEQTYGREVFDDFLRRWFDEHAFTSVTTDDLRVALADLMESATPAGEAPDIELWITGPGLPADAPSFTSAQLTDVDAALAAWVENSTEMDVDDWTYQHWLHFVRGLPDDLPAARMAELDAAYELTATGNNEILAAWMRQGILHGYAGVDDRLEEFLTTVGRRKFLSPLYEAMVETPAGREKALAIYAVARPRYHAIATRTLDATLEWDATN